MHYPSQFDHLLVKARLLADNKVFIVLILTIMKPNCWSDVISRKTERGSWCNVQNSEKDCSDCDVLANMVCGEVFGE